MIDPLTFFKGLGVAVVIVLLFSGLIFWIGYFIIKYRSSMRFFLKYKVFRRQYDEDDVRTVYNAMEGIEGADGLFHAKLLLENKYSPAKVKELMYIYKQMLKRLKGGLN